MRPSQAQNYLHHGLLARMSSDSLQPPGGMIQMARAWRESKAGRAWARVLCSASDESSGDIEWRDFKEARALARSLGLESGADWTEWCMGRERPQGVPIDPALFYGGEGGPWKGWPDFLGYELQGRSSRIRGWRSFEEARGFVWSIGLKSSTEWQEWSKSGERLADIPSNPNIVYKEEGWLSWPDFLGYEAVVWRPFEEARDYARGLGLESWKEWFEWSKSGEKPHDIPATPDQVYKGKGWKSYGDFLGFNEGYVAGEWQSFEEARDYIRGLGLKSQKEWYEWSKSGERPPDVPSTPSRVYKNEGWLSWGDFLGYKPGHIAEEHSTTKKRSFTEVRNFARSLGLKSKVEWEEWRKSGEKPDDIPSNPHRVYKGKGWKSYGDFLGFNEGYVAGEWQSFEEARDYIRGLGLKSQKEWYEWSKSGVRPHDIPSTPEQVYKDEGWLSCGDFLGYKPGHIAEEHSTTKKRSFTEVRDFARSLGLKSKVEWEEWRKSGEKPDDIPSNPHRVYEDEGWLSWGDFLGFNEGYDAGAEWLSFVEARDYARGLGLNSKKQWYEWSKSGQRPRDIPSNPYVVYKNEGWKSWPDFLRHRPRSNAKKCSTAQKRSLATETCEESRPQVKEVMRGMKPERGEAS